MFLVIPGTFHLAGHAPVGDGLRFRAAKVDLWQRLAGDPVQIDGQGQVRLRLGGIDTLEMNFKGWRQPLKYAREALDFLLTQVGIRGNLFGPSHAREGASGYILTRRTEKHGRPVAFIFQRDLGLPEGEEVRLDPALLPRSVNYQLLQAGLAYPTFYEDLQSELREELTQACREARNQGQGFWPLDRTNRGVALDGPEALAKNVIFPKLFRRLARFLKEDSNLNGFKDFLEANPDPVIHLPTGRATSLGALVEVQDGLVRLTAPPEDLVFS